MRYYLLNALVFTSLLAACKKEVEVIKIQEIEKKPSWTEVREFTGMWRTILGMAKGTNVLYFHQPSRFAELRHEQQATKVIQYSHPSSGDTNIRVPISSDFLVTYSDSLVAINTTVTPSVTSATAYIHLRRLDRKAVSVRHNVYAFTPFGAINRNKHLLFAYATADYNGGPDMNFVLAHLTPDADKYSRPNVSSRIISIPITGMGITPSYPTLITAIDDYFMVDCGHEGIYRISQDGTWKRVITGLASTGAECFYKRDGKLFVHETGRIGYSSDNGDTWKFMPDTPDAFRFNTYHTVGDSLVGVYHGFAKNFVFTSKITDTGFRIRPLKDDGLERCDITGLETLGDTVYVATTTGLFKRPLAKFFESKKL